MTMSTIIAQSMRQQPSQCWLTHIFRFALNLYLRFQSVDFNDPSAQALVQQSLRSFGIVSTSMSGDGSLWLPQNIVQCIIHFHILVWWLPFHAGHLNLHTFMHLWRHSLRPRSHPFFSVNNKRCEGENCDFSDFVFSSSNLISVRLLDLTTF